MVETVDELVERIAGVLAGRDEIREAYLFGSCARDARRAHSDIDIATYIAAGEGRDVPNYTTAIIELGRLGILPGDFAREFSSAAGFRNVLVHGYLDVDLALLHRLLNERLDDFETFAGRVEEYLQRS